MNNKYKELAIAAAKRAAHTLAQTALGVIGSAYALGEVNWRLVLSASLLSAIVSVLKSITVGVPEVEK